MEADRARGKRMALSGCAIRQRSARLVSREGGLEIVLNEGATRFCCAARLTTRRFRPANTRPIRSSRGGHLWPAGGSGNCERS